ncbi:MAG: flagellar biosynthesis protein FlhB [Firmicutes bacterium]|nr:flagellar biosynthesis protein FlhB [Bacillota bacterium]
MLARIDLQLFAGEKTEPATPRRREEARKKGQVAKSGEVGTAALVLGGFLALHLLGPMMFQHLQIIVQYFLQAVGEWDGTVPGLQAMFVFALVQTAYIVSPIFLILLVIGLLSQVGQVGFFVSPESITPKFSRINPIEGFKRIFSKRAIVEFFKSFFKIFVIGYIVYRQIRSSMDWLPAVGLVELTHSTALIGETIYSLAIRIGVFLLVIASIDYLYQRWEFEKSIRMSKQEIREEYKQTEGDPLIRSKIRQRQRQIASQRMMQAVPTADVIVTNPTHYAVAIRYISSEMGAPQVVAKGMGIIAQRIKDIAREHDVTAVENPELARALYKTTEIGQEIPAELYPAVAEVLAFVYRLRNQKI